MKNHQKNSYAKNSKSEFFHELDNVNKK
jgi:hypothetical protein